MTKLLHKELTGTIIGVYYDVYNSTARTYPEFIYERAMMDDLRRKGVSIHRIYANAVHHELSLRGLEVLPRREYQVIYRGRPIGEIKFNHLQVGDSLMVFPVAVQDTNDLSINNLKAWMQVQNMSLGILANFYPASLEFMVLRI